MLTHIYKTYKHILYICIIYITNAHTHTHINTYIHTYVFTDYREKTARKPSPDTKPVGPRSCLDFPFSRTPRNKCLLFIHHRVYGALSQLYYRSPNRLRQSLSILCPLEGSRYAHPALKHGGLNAPLS